MPTESSTLFFIILTITIGIILIIGINSMMHLLIEHEYKSVYHRELNKQYNSFHSISIILTIILLFMITISFSSSKGKLYAYRNRIDFISISSSDSIYNKPGFISRAFGDRKTTINSYNFDQLKNYKLVFYNYKYKFEQRELINHINFEIKSKKYKLDNIQ